MSNVKAPFSKTQVILKASDSIKALTFSIICFSIPLAIISLRDNSEEEYEIDLEQALEYLDEQDEALSAEEQEISYKYLYSSVLELADTLNSFLKQISLTTMLDFLTTPNLLTVASNVTLALKYMFGCPFLEYSPII